MVGGCHKHFHDIIILNGLHSLNSLTATVLAFEIQEASRTSRGTAIINIIPLQPDEKVTAMTPIVVRPVARTSVTATTRLLLAGK